MKLLKFLVVLLTFFASSVFVYGYLNEKEIINTIKEYYERNPDTLSNNEYRKDVNIDFVHITDDFNADSYGDLVNIYYTVISSGMNEFTFYCDPVYITCIEDVIDINNNKDLLSYMNNFVNVYNSFKSVKTTYTTSGKITISINKVYSNDEVNIINNKLDEIEKDLYLNSTSDYEKVLAIHDYIINNTKYNIEDENKKNTSSSTAIGVLFNKKATCNGYTDTASLLLDRINIPNVRISNEKHIWNLVYIDNKWLHLDTTWDDPINKLDLNKDTLSHDYFLKTNKEIEEFEKDKEENKHDFNKKIFNFIS